MKFVWAAPCIFLSFTMSLLVPFQGFSYLPHQELALSWMQRREAVDAEYVRGGILADEMGLGKTWMTIGLMLNSAVPETLLLVPPALQPQWSAALKKSGIGHRILGPPSKPFAGSWTDVAGLSSFRITLATYDRAFRKITFLTDGVTYGRMVCDEGHVLRNGPGVKRFRELMSIGVERKWILSGTPVQNRANDFHNLLTFLGMEPSERLKLSLGTIATAVILRRTVGDVREFVPAMPTVKPVHVVHPVVMPAGSEEERTFGALVQRLEHAVEVHARSMIVLELYLRIRQFLAHPDIYVQSMKRKFGRDLYKRTSWEGTASKLSAFEKLLAEAPKEPTIVFATFKGEMDMAETALRVAGYKVYSVRGGMNDAAREEATVQSKVEAEAGVPVAIVVQIVAGGAGLNLQHCSRIIFLSSHWNPAVVDQAIARAYRMGQTKVVHVHHLLIADSAEKNIDRLMAFTHGFKRGLALDIHAKLFCDSAVHTEDIMAKLDEVLDVSEDPV